MVGLSHAETTRRGLSGAVLAHLGAFRLEPRETTATRCLSAWGRVASPRCAHPSGRRPTNRQTGSERNSKAGSDQARMRCTTHFENKVRCGDMHWASPVPDTRGVRMDQLDLHHAEARILLPLFQFAPLGSRAFLVRLIIRRRGASIHSAGADASVDGEPPGQRGESVLYLRFNQVLPLDAFLKISVVRRLAYRSSGCPNRFPIFR